MNKVINTASLYYDINGNCISGIEFSKRYPTRINIAQYEIFGIVVVTEFVGVNHSYDPEAPPLIFETIALESESGDIIFSRWSSSHAEAGKRHVSVSRFYRFGGAFAYWFIKSIRKVWAAL